MTYEPSSDNAFPETDDDDPVRGFYETEIHKIHLKAGIPIPEELKCSQVSYLCKRMSLFSHILLLLESGKITKEEYITFSTQLNIDIILSLTQKKTYYSGWLVENT